MKYNYLLKSEVAQTPFGSLIQAKCLPVATNVLILLLNEERMVPRAVEAIRNVFEHIGQSQHPCQLRIVDIDFDRGWIVMESGETNLDAIVRETPLPQMMVRTFLYDMLCLLEIYEKYKIVHGAVVPSMIFLSSFDDGSFAQGHCKLAFSPGFVGTTTSMARNPSFFRNSAPEILIPDYGKISTRTDLYLLGTTALEALLGRREYESRFIRIGQRSDLQWMQWHSSLREEIGSVKELYRDLDADLEKIFSLLLRKNPKDRAARVVDVLDEFWTFKPVPVPEKLIRQIALGRNVDAEIAALARLEDRSILVKGRKKISPQPNDEFIISSKYIEEEEKKKQKKIVRLSLIASVLVGALAALIFVLAIPSKYNVASSFNYSENVSKIKVYKAKVFKAKNNLNELKRIDPKPEFVYDAASEKNNRPDSVFRVPVGCYEYEFFEKNDKTEKYLVVVSKPSKNEKKKDDSKNKIRKNEPFAVAVYKIKPVAGSKVELYSPKTIPVAVLKKSSIASNESQESTDLSQNKTKTRQNFDSSKSNKTDNVPQKPATKPNEPVEFF